MQLAQNLEEEKYSCEFSEGCELFSKDDVNFIVAVSDSNEFQGFDDSRITFINLGLWSNKLFIPIASIFYLPNLPKKITVM